MEIWGGSGGQPFVQTADARAPFLKGPAWGSAGRPAAKKRRRDSKFAGPLAHGV